MSTRKANVKRSRLTDKSLLPSQAQVSVEEEGFTTGAIVRIRVKNFLTYDAVECHPGPKLNLILGPNGSGKSTIVCAICLGLGGKTSVLGRASSVSDYVKHNASRSYIEIELYNRPQNVVVRRDIVRETNKTTWMIDGKDTTQKNVDELMSRLNIQIGNLCQFLPQDKVADFAKMTPQDLLINTEKAIGPSEMYESHMELKDLGGRLKDMEGNLEKNTNYLEKEKNKNQRLEEQVKNFQDRQLHLQTIEVLQKKKPWLEYEEARHNYTRMKTQHVKIIQDYKKLQEQYAPMQKEIKKLEDTIKATQNQIRGVTSNIQIVNGLLLNKKKAIEAYFDKIMELQGDLEVKKVEERERQRRYNGLKQQLESLKTDLANLEANENLDSIQSDIDKVSKDLTNAEHKQFRLQQREEECNMEKVKLKNEMNDCERELQKMQDVRDIRLDMMKRRNRSAYEAVLWLQENQNKFRKTIYEPVMLLIEVKDPKMAVYIENHISFRDLVIFICEDSQDMNEFLQALRDEKHLQVNAALVPNTPLSSFHPSVPLKEIEVFGFHHYLKDLFTAPDSVMRFLCQNYGLHRIPVGNNRTKEMVQDIFKKTKLSSFYTENNKYSCKRSKYSGQLSSSNFQLRPVSIFTTFLNVERQQYLKNTIHRLKQEYDERNSDLLSLRQELKMVRERMDDLRKEKKQLTVRRDMKRNLLAKINQKEESIRQCAQSTIDLEAEERKISQKILDIVAKRIIDVKSYAVKLRENVEEYKKRVTMTIHSVMQMQQLNKLEKQYRTMAVDLQNREKEKQDSETRLRAVKQEAKQLLRRAQEFSKLAPDTELPQALKNQFAELPGSVEELDAMIHELQAKFDCMLETDENVVLEYNKRKRDIENLEKLVMERTVEVTNFHQKVDGLKQKWLPVLEDLLVRINENFGKFFSLLGCAGEVTLNKGENEENYDKYGISIKVKFRDTEQLKELSPFQQSGGERSVATVLYMMALQELTRVPFRCLDEINQGMDSLNERRVFEFMVDVSSRANTSQYFLITPKLLPDLRYAEGITVLNVYNGGFVPEPEWELKKFIRRRNKINSREE